MAHSVAGETENKFDRIYISAYLVLPVIDSITGIYALPFIGGSTFIGLGNIR